MRLNELARTCVRQQGNVEIELAEMAFEIAAVVDEGCEVLGISARVDADIKSPLTRSRQAAIPLLDVRQADRAHPMRKQHDRDFIKDGTRVEVCLERVQ